MTGDTRSLCGGSWEAGHEIRDPSDEFTAVPVESTVATARCQIRALALTIQRRCMVSRGDTVRQSSPPTASRIVTPVTAFSPAKTRRRVSHSATAGPLHDIYHFRQPQTLRRARRRCRRDKRSHFDAAIAVREAAPSRHLPTGLDLGPRIETTIRASGRTDGACAPGDHGAQNRRDIEYLVYQWAVAGMTFRVGGVA